MSTLNEVAFSYLCMKAPLVIVLLQLLFCCADH
jgi:hypothetical protein